MGTFEVGRNAFCIMILLQTYGDQGVQWDSLNVIDLHKLIGSGIRRCGFVVGMALLKEASHCGGGL